MCSLNGDGELIIPQEVNIQGDFPCKKCGNESTVKLKGRDAFCNDCFILYTTHKFRATLGKSKILKKNDNVLLGHSGKLNSTALISLIKSGMSESVHKRLVFTLKILYIDDGIIKNQSLAERQRIITELAAQVEPFNFDTFVLPLTAVLSSGDTESPVLTKDYNPRIQDSDQTLMETFNQLSNHTAKVDLLKKLKQRLLISTAKRFNCSKVFTAEDSTVLAVSILSNISLGRGTQLSFDAGFTDHRDKDVTILRPIKDFTTRELEMYSTLNQLNVVETGQLDWRSSIQQLTEDFIVDLDSKFGGTVSTIFKTGQKVQGSDKQTVQGEICPLCCSPLDTSPLDDATSAIDATNFSKLVSSQGSQYKVPQNFTGVNGECGNCSGTCGKKAELDVSDHLCYGCRLIVGKSDVLPEFLVDFVQQKLAREKMYKEINEFLLE